MAHLRRTNHKARAEVDEPAGQIIDMPTATLTPVKHRPFYKCTACNLVLFGLAMALFGTLFGMYFKSTIELAFSRHMDGISDLHRQASEAAATLSLPFRSAVYDPDKAVAQGLAEGQRIKASWSQRGVNKTVCDESCPLSKDGKCDDGRSGAGEVLCDLGTDCSDCGPWTFQLPPGEKKIPKPIELLREHKVTVNIAQTATQPAFLMPYTNPEQDIDVSEQMAHQKVVELGLTQAWYKALSGRCELPNGERALVLDVGGNFGWYTFYAASHGCRVVVWEPVPVFRAFLEFGLQVNNMTTSVRVRARVVGEQPGLQYNLTVPSQGIWGTASIDGRNIDTNTVGDKSEIVAAVSERVDSLIQEDALVVKIDVEGFEPSAFKSMKGVFDNYEVSSFFMEYSPGVYEHGRMWEQLPDMPNMLISLLKEGFTILHVNDSLARGVSLLGSTDWSGNLPLLEQVTLENLEHDLDDCRKLRKGILGCYAPEELARINDAWQSCNAIPEDLHPKSFRATFGHNTNIWAFKNRTDLKIGPPVGIQSLSQQEQEWYGRNKDIGMGGRSCATIWPDAVILRHRCPCKKLSCLEEAYVLEKLAKKGLMRKITNRSNGR